MALSLGIIFGIIAMLSWGIADIFAKKAVDRIGHMKSLVINRFAAILPLFIYVVLFLKLPSISVNLILITTFVSFFGILGYIYFYKGFEKGNVSIVSPIASSWVVITALLSIFIFKEMPTTLQICGMILIFAGIFLTCTNLRQFRKSIRREKTNGVLEAIIAMISWGICFVLIKPLVNIAGPVISTFFIGIMMFVFIFSWTRIIKIKFTISGKLILLFLVLSGLLDTIGFVAFNTGITTEAVSIVSPIAATFPIVTIILASIFLKERMVLNQKIGVGIVLIGLVLISLI